MISFLSFWLVNVSPQSENHTVANPNRNYIAISRHTWQYQHQVIAHKAVIVFSIRSKSFQSEPRLFWQVLLEAWLEAGCLLARAGIRRPHPYAAPNKAPPQVRPTEAPDSPQLRLVLIFGPYGSSSNSPFSDSVLSVLYPYRDSSPYPTPDYADQLRIRALKHSNRIGVVEARVYSTTELPQLGSSVSSLREFQGASFLPKEAVACRGDRFCVLC